jgi:membrane protease YdiL (CAAX protease family)
MKILFNAESRLRSGWRILIQFTGFVILLVIAQSIQDVARERRDALMFGIGGCLYLLGGLGMVWGVGRWLDRRKFVDYGFHLNREWWMDFGVGLLIGAFTLTVVFAVEWMAGWVRIASVTETVFDGSFILIGGSVLLSLLAVGVIEELVFRGYQLRNLAEGLRFGKKSGLAVTVAWVGTSMLFGIAHLMNQGATLFSSMNVALVGMLLGWGYVVTGELALPIGLHISWGFFEEFVYGFANSGQSPVGWLIGSQVHGPELWTGGAFGPEAGLIVTLMILLDGLLVMGWVKYRRRWKGIRGELSEYQRG